MDPRLVEKYSINRYYQGFIGVAGQSLDPRLKLEQNRLLIRQWGGRSPIDGRKIKIDSAGYPTESITRHHYAYKAFDPMNYYDCRINALVPIPEAQHLPSGEPHTPLWYHRFRLAKETIAEGYIPVPMWWDSYPGGKQNRLDYIKELAALGLKNFMRLIRDPQYI